MKTKVAQCTPPPTSLADPAKLLLWNKCRVNCTQSRQKPPPTKPVSRSPPNRNHNPTLTLITVA